MLLFLLQCSGTGGCRGRGLRRFPQHVQVYGAESRQTFSVRTAGDRVGERASVVSFTSALFR
ncbi:hypothetical protein ABH19_04065 [Leptospirillum sp. Group II 'CF-1']|nr:hypothetical protein ABH19_04065 [Leptospirillum sp. Group II 'CF-1']